MILQFMLVPIGELLERHPRHRTATPRCCRRSSTCSRGTAPPADVSPLLEQLSDAELRVLRYLPSNLRAPEIAAELFVSANTVRTHLRHIYAKLDVHTRTAAVGRARELGLLAPTSRRR